jgi:ArsR family transcriptional regulator
MQIAPRPGAESSVDTNVAFARFFRIFGDPTRLAIIRRLLIQPHTVAELVAQTGATRSRVSNHLACLRWCQAVSTERRGRSMVYSVRDDRLRELLRLAEELTEDNLEHLSRCDRIGPP